MKKSAYRIFQPFSGLFQRHFIALASVREFKLAIATTRLLRSVRLHVFHSSTFSMHPAFHIRNAAINAALGFERPTPDHNLTLQRNMQWLDAANDDAKIHAAQQSVTNFARQSAKVNA